MSFLTDTANNLIEKLGKSFLLAGYFPSLLFVLLHQIFLFPIWLKRELSIFTPQQVQNADEIPNLLKQLPAILSIDLTIILMPVIIGIFLLSLNSIVIRFYEGKYGLLQRGILYPLQRFNVACSQKLFGEILGYKDAYLEALAEFNQAKTHQEIITAQQKLDSLTLKLKGAFEGIEHKNARQILPMRKKLVTPTALGNAAAIIEERPFNLYGIDSVLIWPRLRPLLLETAPELVDQMVNQKIILDMLLNLSLLTGIFAMETIFTLRFGNFSYGTTLLVISLSSLVLFWLFYKAGVSAMWSLGNFISIAFDYHRHLVLKKFGFKIPENLHDEQIIWLKLAAFLRRGDLFYWPQNQISPESDSSDNKTPPPDNDKQKSTGSLLKILRQLFSGLIVAIFSLIWWQYKRSK